MLQIHTHTHTRTHRITHTDLHAHAHTHTRAHTHNGALMRVCVSLQLLGCMTSYTSSDKQSSPVGLLEERAGRWGGAGACR